MKPARSEDKVAQRLEEAAAFARERDGAAPAAFEAFLRHYFSQADADDVMSRAVPDLYGAAMAHWQLAQTFPSGNARIRVYNPDVEQSGWYCEHTVVEIVNDDMPFLVDSVTTEINRLGLALHSAFHPVFRVWRDVDGQRRRAAPSSTPNREEASGGAPADAGRLESYIHLEVDRCTEAARLQALHAGIAKVLGDVRAAVEDWPQMRSAAQQAVAALSARERAAGRAPDEGEEIAEARAFLAWMIDDHFTFLGQRDYQLVSEQGTYYLQPDQSPGLGILREALRAPGAAERTALAPEAVRVIEDASPIFLTKANSRATVHRPGYLDYVGVKLFDAAGKVCGERRFLGLYTSSAYMEPTGEIPLVRRKVAAVVQRAGFLPKGHLAKSLQTILEQYPRDELFQIDSDTLFEIAMGILRLQERQRTRLFVRRDRFDRFVSCLVFVPREKFNTDLRLRIQQLLQTAYQGSGVEFTPLLSESMLARIHITVRTEPGQVPEVDVRDLEARIVQAARRWQDELADALLERCGEEQGNRLLHRYGGSFPAGFREDYAARGAVHDIQLMEQIVSQAGARDGALAMHLYRPIEAPPGTLRFKIYQVGRPIALSRSLPMLEHLGVLVNEERPYRIEPHDAEPIWIHDFGMQSADGAEVDLTHIKPLFEEAFARIWAGDAENDGLNRLVLRAGLKWPEVRILRAYARYMRQIGSTFSDAYMERALTGNPAIARLLVSLFQARFDPAMGETHAAAREARVQDLQQQIAAALDDVPNLDEDRILRQFLGVLEATLRTNDFQRAAQHAPKPYLSLKFDPARVPGLPEPKPMFEIWVYSPRVEGVHLRGGKVARGGLRWSDRREDFRTEVLGLVKAQMVKNTVIVPVGSKGGFVVKQAPAEREAYLKEGVACYQTFLRGLLDLTDNLVEGRLVPPPDVVRFDPDDPYLVVAADKGTATFSDYANAISAEYGFWLDDAFASGGSVGYDHKKMGITARGAWESVKRHFREMGVDTQQTDFTVAGIGDMSGDVFGNAMLLSRHIRLVAAFDHRHIFLDPAPDPQVSFAERERLFKLPRSSWDDYDRAAISPGGGVFARTVKSIVLSPQVRAALGVSEAELAPADLMRAILRAPVDLFYNGGIGTYVKASYESHAQVGDRANDAVRVDGADLRCKVVAEGGNLGCTQFGRIEFAQRGGRINTDAIDNSAGVDCSDHEVNIKILLGLVVADGEMTLKQRNALLASMADEVGELVLRDNYYQTRALSLARDRAPAWLDAEARLMAMLEREGRLNRAIEFLPDDAEIERRRAGGQGLTSPERAVLMAYSKMWLSDLLLASDLLEAPFVARDLPLYFPQPLRSRFAQAMTRHPLQREILATMLANALVNRAGVTFVHRMTEETGAEPAQVVRASLIARAVFRLDDVWQAIDALDDRVGHEAQAAMFADTSLLLERATLWFLHHQAGGAQASRAIEDFGAAVADLAPALDGLLVEDEAQALAQRQSALVEGGVPDALALQLASTEALVATLDIAEVAAACGRSLRVSASVYFALDQLLGYAWLHDGIASLPARTHWQMLARAALFETLAQVKRGLTRSVLRLSPQGDDALVLIEAWRSQREEPLARYRRLAADQHAAGPADLAMLSVTLKALGEIETFEPPLNSP
ncbi:putative NAD-glutamate dehydrogenase [Pandoraea thiooxydans]|uniref:NAD-glutamate dehydrogenase n=1 Tax=Pandoraea thiooxydans TaxID=445709 RepID=A0A0G3EQ07_9BURK|nr:NAD-glutamate dehydrogenase [Pandoraea thiooxydans]AKJ69163.1 NAD-glutamate dehydrogenase [Pandoraea thiooxydans]APR96746.1 putative NAD-glutamate dehydrogenase [Pandoraea thiooxydans]